MAALKISTTAPQISGPIPSPGIKVTVFFLIVFVLYCVVKIVCGLVDKIFDAILLEVRSTEQDKYILTLYQ